MSLGPYPDFAWSVSRHGTLRECARKYFYSTYGMWSGWEEDAAPETRLAYRLKKLEKLDLALGTAIHRRAYELTTLAQEGEELPSADALREKCRTELAHLYRGRVPDFVRDPKGSPMLHGFYYGDGPDEDTLERVRDKLDRCLPHLRELDLWRRIREWELGVPYASDPDQFTDPVVEVDGVPIYADPDLLLHDREEDRFTVLDWKTGAPRESHERQVAVYGLFARERFGAADLRGRLVYLLDGAVRDVDLPAFRLDEATDWIRDGITQMRALVADPEKNRPRPKEHFPLTENRWVCKGCPYLELCEEELRSDGPLPWEREVGGTPVGPAV